MYAPNLKIFISKKYMKIIHLIFLMLATSACSKDSGSATGSTPETETDKPVQINEEAFAFPGAQGFGQKTSGGRGGKVLFVTNLNDSGAGSLRAAVESDGARIILFKVSGNISLKSALKINNPNITIAGQSAPGDGICVKDYPVSVAADNVIIRYMRFRMGDEAQQEGDALGGRFHKNIIIDHCSMSWCTDECVSFYANENTSVQWCFISESLKTSFHVKGSHGYGGVWGGKNASFHHNLLAHHDSRNPRLGEEAGKAFALTDLVDLRNNVIYNWGGNSCYGGEAMNVNIINCYYKPGPMTSKTTRIVSIDKNKISGTEVYDIWGKFYISGNYVDGSPATTENNWDFGVYNQFHSSYGVIADADKAAMKLAQPLDIKNNVTTHTALVAYDRVLAYGGANLVRDAVDKRIVDNVKNKTYSFEGSNGGTKGAIDSQTDVGGWPELKSTTALLDTDNDGMPDEWEIKMKLNPKQANANGKELSTAYDNIEVYVNSIVEAVNSGQYD